MKKDRDCGMPYPIYPPYQGMNMVPPYGMMNQGVMPPMMAGPTYSSSPSSNVSSNTIEQQINTLEQQVNSLDKRISTLENMYNNSNFSNTKYNSSNYQMM